MLGILTAVPQILSFLSIMCDQQRLADLLFPVYLASIGKLGMVSSLPSQYVLFQAQGSPVAAKLQLLSWMLDLTSAIKSHSNSISIRNMWWWVAVGLMMPRQRVGQCRVGAGLLTIGRNNRQYYRSILLNMDNMDFSYNTDSSCFCSCR